MPNPVEVVKRAAVEAVEAQKPVHLLFGQVISVSPLKIQVDQKSIYTEKMLVLTRNVTDFEVDMTVSHITLNRAGGSGDPAFASHNHDYKGKKKFKVHNALIKGDWVLLGRIQGGKRFVVIDRIKPIPRTEGGMVMIPNTGDDLRQDFVFTTLPSRTFKMNHDTLTITGTVDQIRAVEQAVFLILNTERYFWLIHSWNYGVELHNLIGKDPEYCIPEIERRIREALLQDDRITAVEIFSLK